VFHRDSSSSACPAFAMQSTISRPIAFNSELRAVAEVYACGA